MHSRRKFIAHSSALALGGLALQSFNTKNFSRIRTAAADQIRIGAIGINGMGWANTLSMLKNPGVTLAALCDVDKNVLDNRMRELSKMKIDTSNIKTYNDYRSLLDRKDIDAVIIGTPDHWHALIMIHAVQAGKDVYVEKPVGNSIAECRAMVAAQEKYNKVVQAGQWQRSQQHFRDAVDFIRSGQLGNIRTVKVWCYQGWMKPGPKVADSAAPDGVDYKLWLGPAKARPFNSSRFHFNFRWFWDYAGGLMTDWGVHLMDYAIFGMDASVPKTVSALGGDFAYPDLYQETPDTLAALYQFDNFNLIWDHAMGIDNGLYGKDHGIAFIGNNATLELDRGGWEVLEEKRSSKKVSVLRKGPSDNGLDKHTQNFINVVHSRKLADLNCPIQTGAHIATVCQMGNIAFRSQEKVTWDKATNKFTNSKLNASYFMAPYHNGYQLPKI
ncbi:Gfo/Idh/MocA family oxidoreductase [Niabella sp. CC-SYL272]|uniref:Gfo/Idh/MocA family protein n=1 Tax=Niabella agricola TaxID=2891571 RepID=UPI001F343A69|nr:Gfo/Idh/MocA family oxidoreductase [Niabella agricola]MCF3110684.1 Gfo/Idh/MocA family oxidoreductase [Niabella agricola]